MIRTLLMALCLPLVTAASAVAEPVNYTFSGVGSGLVDGSAFSQASFVIEVEANTDDVALIDLSDFGYTETIFAVEARQSSFWIEGVGSGQFLSDTLVFVNQTAGIFGFSKGLLSEPLSIRDVFTLTEGFFASYDLRSSAGPITFPSPGVPEPFVTLDSTRGPIVFTSADGPMSFQATVVPEPSSLALVGLPALLGIYWGRRRLRERNRA